MSDFIVRDPQFDEKVRASFALQTVMTTISASLHAVAAGEVQITMPYNPNLTQHDGFLHAGIITTLMDSACGYAALTLMPPDSNVLAVEFKVNFLSPAHADHFIAIGRVLKSGRTITVCQGQLMAHTGDSSKQVAQMQATMIRVATQPSE